MTKFKEDMGPLKKKWAVNAVLSIIFLFLLYFGLPYVGFTLPDWAMIAIAAIFIIFAIFELIRIVYRPPIYELDSSDLVIKNGIFPLQNRIPYASIENVEKLSTDMAIEKYGLAKHKRGQPGGGAIIHFLVSRKNVIFLKYHEIVLLHIKKGEPTGLPFDLKEYPRIIVLAPENPDMFASALRNRIK